jgi:hypothetical protein
MEKKELDRIYRMDRIFFAFPEERQKVPSLFHPERVQTINPKNPVNPVKIFF